MRSCSWGQRMPSHVCRCSLPCLCKVCLAGGWRSPATDSFRSPVCVAAAGQLDKRTQLTDLHSTEHRLLLSSRPREASCVPATVPGRQHIHQLPRRPRWHKALQTIASPEPGCSRAAHKQCSLAICRSCTPQLLAQAKRTTLRSQPLLRAASCQNPS